MEESNLIENEDLKSLEEETDVFSDENFGAQIGNPMDNRENIIESLFNTEKRLELLYHSWSGHQKVPTEDGKSFVMRESGSSLAGAKFINKEISAFRAIINETNSFSKKTDDECKRILYDSNKAFIKDMVNDSSIKKRDYRTLAKTFEHALELFLGLVEFGHGANVLRDALAGINTPDAPRPEKKWFEGLK